MATYLDMSLGRTIDRWGGLLICGVLFAYSRLRARLGGPGQPTMLSTTPPDARDECLTPRRILAIKTYGLGNIAMLIPVLGSLRRAYPDAEIDFLSLESNRPLLERSGVVNRVFGLDLGGYAVFLAGLWRVVRALRRRRYELVIDFEQFIKFSTILAFVSGAPHRVGFNTDAQRRGWLYTRRVVYRDSEHMRQIFERPLRALGIEETKAPVSIETKAEEEAHVIRVLEERGVERDHHPVVVVHVGSGPMVYDVPLKRWPISHFASLCDGLAERHGAAIVLTGQGAEEVDLIRDTMRAMRRPALDTCDLFTVAELVALLKRSHLAIANDTSVMHLAALVRTPVVSFFGATDPYQYGPQNPEDLTFYAGLFCSPCLTNYNLKVSHCADPVCIRDITAEEVLEGIEQKYFGPGAASLLSRPGGSARPGA